MFKKKIRIRIRPGASKLYFKFFCIVILCLPMIIIAAYTGNITTQALANQQAYTVCYTRVVVDKGDTLWQLAKNNGNEKQDIRKKIKIIKEVNKISSNIIPGDIIYIPTT